MTIYYVTIIIIALWAGKLKNANYSYERQKKFICFAFGLLILLAALRSPSVGRDLSYHYAQNYQRIASSSWNQLPAFSVFTGYEIGFVVLCKLLSYVSNNVQWFIAVISIFIYFVTARFILKYSENVVLSTFIMIFSCTYYMYMNVLRQALAVSIILLGYDLLQNQSTKRYMRYMYFLIHIAIATSIHQSAIICLVFLLIDTLRFERKHIVIAMLVVSGFYFLYDKLYSATLLFVGNSDRYAAHIKSVEGVGGIDRIAIINISLTFGAFILGYFFLVFNKRRSIKTTEDNDYSIEIEHEISVWLYTSLFAGTFRLLATRMNILNRATYYFLPFVFVLYPTAINRSGRYRKIIKYGVYSAYFLYFYIMTTRLASEYYGTVPYIFFWQKI